MSDNRLIFLGLLLFAIVCVVGYVVLAATNHVEEAKELLKVVAGLGIGTVTLGAGISKFGGGSS